MANESICMCMYGCVCVCERKKESEREREGESKRESELVLSFEVDFYGESSWLTVRKSEKSTQTD